MRRLKDRELEQKLLAIDPEFCQRLHEATERFDDYYGYEVIGFGDRVQIEREDGKYDVRRFFLHVTEDDIYEDEGDENLGDC